MKAIRILPPPPGCPVYSSTEPPTSLSLQLVEDVPRPHVSRAGELVIQIKATTVIRDSLTWPELYASNPAKLGNDFSGIVVEIHAEEKRFQPGDEVYGMADARRGGTWAEYALVTFEEVYLKPAHLSWEEAAALPLSSLTADQALFDHAQLVPGTTNDKSILVTGAVGAVGLLVVQFAIAAGCHVVAATSSNARNEEFLRSLGAEETIEYGDLPASAAYDAVIDTVGADVLRCCWRLVSPNGNLVSVDSASWNFVQEHRDLRVSNRKEHVRASFFIVQPSEASMKRITTAVTSLGVKGIVSRVMSFNEAPTAYDLCHSRGVGRGKIVLIP